MQVGVCHKWFIVLAGTPVLRTGREVRNLAYRISETIEPKNQKVGRNMEIWVYEVPLIEMAMIKNVWVHQTLKQLISMQLFQLQNDST